MHKFKLFLALFLVTGILTQSCGKKLTLAEKVRDGQVTLQDVFKEAVTLMEKRKYQEARQWLRVIEAQGADTSFFDDAKLLIADSYFFDVAATYIEASVEYKSFLTHFPSHGKADYAQYQYAMCFFTEIERPDRDQTSTLTAYTEFKNLLDKFSNTPYASKAREKIELCQQRLAEHEFTVGYYYFRRGKGFEMSSESRLKYIVNNYEGQFDQEKVYFYLAETLWRRAKYEEAIRYYYFLQDNFAQSEFLPFIEDKLRRYERIKEEGVDPGILTEALPVDDVESR